MPVPSPSLPPSLYEALDADPTLWPGPLSPEGRAELEELVGAMPAEVRDEVVSAIVDPERNPWSRAAVQGIVLAATAGAAPVGLLTDDLIEMVDAREERFGLVPIGVRLPPEPCGPAADVVRLLDGLDQTFDHRRYILYLRRPVPAGVDVGPICKAVQLWLGQVDRRDRAELHAFYEDDDVAIDLTVVETPGPSGARAEGGGGRVLTVAPLESLERLASVDTQLVEAASRSEESIGSLPLVMVAAADRPWALPRGFVQWLLLGTPDAVVTERGPEGTVHEATFTPNGRYESLFVDPACRAIAALWWTELLVTDPAEPFRFVSRAYDNPWATVSPALAVRGPRFAPLGEPDRKRTVSMRWEW
jgi:hypothetical protein